MSKFNLGDENDLLKIFNLKNSLEIKDPDQLKRIRKKLDFLINSKKLHYLLRNSNKKIINNNKIKLKKIPKDIINEIYYKEIVMKNLMIFLVSLTAYFYFSKYTDALSRVNSIYHYKKIFVVTFCFIPVLLNYKFSVMNYEYKILQMQLGKYDFKKSSQINL
jgi:hypothetical protein